MYGTIDLLELAMDISTQSTKKAPLLLQHNIMSTLDLHKKRKVMATYSECQEIRLKMYSIYQFLMDVIPDPISPGPGTYDVIKATQIKPTLVSMRQKLPDFCKAVEQP